MSLAPQEHEGVFLLPPPWFSLAVLSPAHRSAVTGCCLLPSHNDLCRISEAKDEGTSPGEDLYWLLQTSGRTTIQNTTLNPWFEVS